MSQSNGDLAPRWKEEAAPIYPRLMSEPMTLDDVEHNLEVARPEFKHLCDVMNHSGPNLRDNAALTVVEDEIKLLLNLQLALKEAEQLKAAIRWVLSEDFHGSYAAEFRNEIDDFAHSHSINAEHAARLLAVLEEAS